jgi:23S rRNA (adenine-N6)-dimethyltransferase
VSSGDLVLDIGAGHGALVAPLVATGARVVAVELHDERVRCLRERYAGDPVTVVQTDASDLRLPRRPFRVVANPPFTITTSLIRRLTSKGSRLVRADLVVPRHVAARWTAGRGIGSAGYDATMRGLPRRALRPRPPNDVAVLTLRRAPRR